MKHDMIAQTLSELGNDTRLAIFRMLIKLGTEGATIGEIGKSLKVPLSTLGFHLSGLVKVGLVKQIKEGKSVYCFAQVDVLREVLHNLESECCEEMKSDNGN